jgi:calcineurin-like phosphoesterase family protein
VPGNHDEKIMDMWHHPIEPVWESRGVSDIKILPDLFELSHEGKRFAMSHYPMADWNGKFKGSIHLHGHVHTQYANGKAKSHIPKVKGRYDVGVDMFGGPVQLTGDLRYLNNPRGWNG